MKKILFAIGAACLMFLTACDNCEERAERFLGAGATCSHGGDNQVLCNQAGESYLCFTRNSVACAKLGVFRVGLNQ